MPEIADRVPGGQILASYSNQIRDRACMRYTDRTARAASVPLPAIGELSYITSDGSLEIYDGTAWRQYLTDEDRTKYQARLDLLEMEVWSDYFTEERSLSGTFSEVVSVTIPTDGDGDWYAELVGFVEYDIQLAAGLSTPAVSMRWLRNGGLQTNIDRIGGTGEGRHGANIAHRRGFIAADGDALVAGDTIGVALRTNSSSVLSATVAEYQLRAKRITAGVIGPENP